MARCRRPQLREPRQGAVCLAPQLRAEPSRPTVSKRGHQPPRGPAVGRVVISGNGAGSAGVRGRAGRRSGRCRGARAGLGGAPPASAAGAGSGPSGRRAATRPRPQLSLSLAEKWRREGRGLGVFQPRPPVTVRLPECGPCRRRRAGVQSRGRGAGPARGGAPRVAGLCACGPRRLGGEGGRCRCTRGPVAPTRPGGRRLGAPAPVGEAEWGSSEQGARQVGRVIT